jgi:hypothetical protein
MSLSTSTGRETEIGGSSGSGSTGSITTNTTNANTTTRDPPKKTCPLQLRAELEDFFDRLSLYAGSQEHSISVPFDVQFSNLVSEYSTQAIQQALLLTSIHEDPHSTSSSSYTGRLPIHLACDKCAPRSVIQWLIEHDPTKTSIQTPDKWGDLPLHTACSRQNYIDVIQMLLDADPTTIHTCDFSGMLRKYTMVKKNKTRHKNIPLEFVFRRPDL